MSLIKRAVVVPANGTATADLRPYDRFGGRGGAVRFRSTVIAAAVDAITETIYIGSELVEEQSLVGIESAAGRGPDQFSLPVEGAGSAGDPITVTYRNLTGTQRTVTLVMEIINA